MNKPIGCIKEILNATSLDTLPSVLEQFRQDQRLGVKNLIVSYEKKIVAAEKEKERIKNINFYENMLYEKGLSLIAGIDEVGRGPLAGPVMACAVILPKGVTITGINDSKKLTAQKRNELYTEIMEKAISVGIGAADHTVIDEINILQATYQAMRIALDNLQKEPESILVDGYEIPVKIPQQAIVKGDSKSISIAAASIVAKVTRDALMYQYHQQYPHYNFDSNKGYGTADHIEAIKHYGLCDIHRRSFCRNLFDGKNG